MGIILTRSGREKTCRENRTQDTGERPKNLELLFRRVYMYGSLLLVKKKHQKLKQNAVS